MLAYAVMGLAVFCMMQSLGEMATQLPIRGSFEAYAERFIDPSLAFAVGWNYWFSWAVTLAAELVAGALIVQFWFPHSNPSLCSMGFFAFVMILNLLSVRAYAEAEYWFAGIKVVTVIIFLAVGFLMIAGMVANQHGGFQNWFLADADAHTHAPFVGGWTAALAVFLVAGFSFQGTEGVGIAAAETADPQKNVPKAIRSVFWRILLFYIGSIFVIGTLIGYTDPNLLRADETHIAFSPFTMVFQRLPWGYYAANLINAVILSSVLSCGNSSLYVASRMLHAMSHGNMLPSVVPAPNGTGTTRKDWHLTQAPSAGVARSRRWRSGLVSNAIFDTKAPVRGLLLAGTLTVWQAASRSHRSVRTEWQWTRAGVLPRPSRTGKLHERARRRSRSANVFATMMDVPPSSSKGVGPSHGKGKQSSAGRRGHWRWR